MNYWKQGCRWNEGKDDYYRLVKEDHVVFCGDDKIKPVPGDMVAVCRGFTVMAIGKVLTDPVSITDPKYGHLKEYVKNYKIDYKDWNKAVDILFHELSENEQFIYKTQTGLCQIRNSKIINQINQLHLF